MRPIVIIIVAIFFVGNISAQSKLYTKTGTISFHSKAAMENIDAKNNKVLSVWTPADGRIEFSVLMKGFEFDKALMQEHFNDDYVESDKFPKASFKGVIADSKNISLAADNSYNVKVTGDLMIHGVTKHISIPAVIKVKGGVASATANFNVLLADYNIKIPAVVADNVSKLIAITVNIAAFQTL